MNQKGEVTLFGVFAVLSIFLVFILSTLELRKSFHFLAKRTDLLLCLKETKGEMKDYLTLMGRTNWGIKNIRKAQLLMMFIPGLQGASADAQKLKEALILYQNVSLVSYLKKLSVIRSKGCALDPRLFLTPYELSGVTYKRDLSERAILRSDTWKNIFFSSPYLVTMSVRAEKLEALTPKPDFTFEERTEKLSFLLSSL